MSEALILAIEELLTRGPDIVAGIRDFFAGNPGASPEELAAKLAEVKASQAAAEKEWAADLPVPGIVGEE